MKKNYLFLSTEYLSPSLNGEQSFQCSSLKTEMFHERNHGIFQLLILISFKYHVSLILKVAVGGLQIVSRSPGKLKPGTGLVDYSP